MTTERSEFDRRLLSLIQTRVPLVREPFAELASELGAASQQVMDRMRALRTSEGVIREIAGIFDAASLGYRQALVAFRVPPDRLDRAGGLVAGHPGVSHCYGRRGEYNLWFTLAASPHSRLGLEGGVGRLADLCGAVSHRILPTLRRYKLDVRFGADEDEADRSSPAGPAQAAPSPAPRRSPAPLEPAHVQAIRALQIDLPIQADPFAPLAAQAGMSADQLLVHAADFLACRWMRRYSAVLHHRAAGAAANVMVVWKVDPARADAAGAACAQVSAVSHCYLRPTFDDWPYGLYTMVHGRSPEDCRLAIDEIALNAGLSDHLELWTETEYKKQRVRLFTGAEERWESENPAPR